MIKIDENTCVGCGACERDCVSFLLKIVDGKACPPPSCFECGHCIGVCPVNALSMDDDEYDVDDVEELDKCMNLLDPDELLRAVKGRRSYRQYTTKLIEKEKLDKIFDIARYTATGSNCQEFIFVVVQERMDEFKKLAWDEFRTYMKELPPATVERSGIMKTARAYDGTNVECDTLFWGAPCLVIVGTMQEGGLWDAGLSTQAMELMANALGLGTLYSGFLKRVIGRSDALREWLGIRTLNIQTCTLMGYPAVNYQRTVPRKFPIVIER